MKSLSLKNLAFALTLALTPVAFAQDAVKPVEGAGDEVAAPKTFVAGDPVANVSGKPYSKADYDKLVAFLGGQGQPAPTTADQVKELLESVTVQQLLADKAIADALDQSEDVKTQLKFINQGVLASTYVKKFADGLKVDEQEMRAEYDKEVAALEKNEYKASHILVNTEEEAKKIIEELAAGKSFEDLAKEHSLDGSGQQGGDLGWFSAKMMVPEFSASVQSLEKGKYTTEPVKTQFGYHIIRLDDAREVTPPAFEDLKPQFEANMKQKKIQELIENLKKEAAVEVLGQ